MGVQTDRELPGEADLEIIFSIRHLRKVGEDNTIRYQGRIYQVLLSNSIREFGEKGFLKKKKVTFQNSNKNDLTIGITIRNLIKVLFSFNV